MRFVVINLGEGGGGGWSQIKPIAFGNELRTYDMIPEVTSLSPVSLFLSLSHLTHNINLKGWFRLHYTQVSVQRAEA